MAEKWAGRVRSGARHVNTRTLPGGGRIGIDFAPFFLQHTIPRGSRPIERNVVPLHRCA